MVLIDNEWERRRSEFNHDWLKNTYLRRLRAFLDRLALAPDSPVIVEFLANDFPLWRGKTAEVQWLAAHLAECLSPRRYFDVKPLALASAETKAWLPDAIHQVWFGKFHVSDAIANLEARISAVETTYQELSRELQPGTKGAALAGLRPRFEAYEVLCRELSSELSEIRKTIWTI